MINKISNAQVAQTQQKQTNKSNVSFGQIKYTGFNLPLEPGFNLEHIFSPEEEGTILLKLVKKIAKGEFKILKDKQELSEIADGKSIFKAKNMKLTISKNYDEIILGVDHPKNPLLYSKRYDIEHDKNNSFLSSMYKEIVSPLLEMKNKANGIY